MSGTDIEWSAADVGGATPEVGGTAQTPPSTSTEWTPQDVQTGTAVAPISNQNMLQGVVAYFEPSIKYVMAKAEMGRQGVADAIVWHHAMTGSMSDEDAIAQTSNAKLAAMKAENIDPIEATFSIPGIPLRILGATAQALPIVGAVAAGTYAHAATGAVTGALFGMGAGAVGGPLAGATAAGGAVAGWNIGMAGGAFDTAYQIFAAQHYGETIKQGVPRDRAFDSAIAYGAFAGALQAARFDSLNKLVSKPLLDHLKTDAGKALLQNAIVRNIQKIASNTAVRATTKIAKESAKQTALMEAQELANIVTDWLAKRASGMPVPSLKEMGTRLMSGLEEAAYASVGLSTGAATSRRLWTAFTQKNKPSRVDLAKAIQQDTDAELDRLMEQVKANRAAMAQPKELTAKEKAEAEKLKSQLWEKRKKDDAAATTKALNDLIGGVTAKRGVPLQGRAETHTVKLPTNSTKLRVQRELADIDKRISDLEREIQDAQTAENSASGDEFHGTSKAFTNDAIDEGHSQPRNLYGVGFYTTDNLGVARQYTKKGKGKTPTVYKVHWRGKSPANLIDLESPPNKALQAVLKKWGEERGNNEYAPDVDAFADRPLREWYKALQDNMEDGFTSDWTAWEVQQGLADFLEQHGYNGFKHIGGGRVNKADPVRHQVRIYFNPTQDNIKLESVPAPNTELPARLQKLQQRQAELTANLTDIERVLSPLSAPIKPDANGEVSISISKKGWQLPAFRDLAIPLANWSDKIHWILQDVPKQLAQKIASAVDVHEYVKDESARRDEYNKRLRDALVESTGMNPKELMKYILQGKVEEITVHGANIKGTSDTFTRNEAITVLMEMQDPDAMAGLHFGNGYTFENTKTFKGEKGKAFTIEGRAENSTEAQLADHIGDTGRNIIEGLRKFYKEMGADLKDAFWKAEGKELKVSNEHYSGQLKRQGWTGEDTAEQFVAHLFGIAETQEANKTTVGKAGAPGETIARVKNKLPLLKRDWFDSASRHAMHVAHYAAWRLPSVRILNPIFSGNSKLAREFKTAVIDKFGYRTWKAIEYHLQQMTTGNLDAQDAYTDWLNRTVLKNAGTAFLAIRAHQFIKQTLAIGNALLTEVNGKQMPTSELTAGIADFLRHPKAAMAVLEKSSLFRNRYAGSDSTWLGAVSSGELSRMTPFERQALKDMIMLPVTMGDKAACLVGGHAVYRWVLNETGSATKAMRAFEDYFERTQSSSNIHSTSNLARGPLRFLMVFQQQPISLFMRQINDIREAVNHPSVESITNAVRTVMVTHITQASFDMLTAATIQLTSHDQKKKDEAWWRAGMSLLEGPMHTGLAGLISGAVGLTANLATGSKHKVAQPNDILVSSLESTWKMGVQIQHMQTKHKWGDVDEWLKLGIDYARGPNILLPYVGGVPWGPILEGVQIARGKKK